MKNPGESTIITENLQQVGSFGLDKVGVEGTPEVGAHSLQIVTQGKASSILSDMRQALSLEGTTQAKDQAREFQERMENFTQEARRVREGFGYGGNSLMDYMWRFSVSNSVVIDTFERILSENEGLKVCYEVVVGGFSGDRKKLKERILKEYGEDLVYEGMKKGEYSEDVMILERLDISGKSAKEIKDMVVGYARNGGKGLRLGAIGLNEIFTGEQELFKDMVVGYARLGGKGLDLGANGLSEIFVDNPKLFKDMVVEFVRFGGKWLNLGANGLNEIFTGEPELFKDMVVGYVRNGGKLLNLKFNQLHEIFAREPELFKEMVVGYARNGGKVLDLSYTGLNEIFAREPELFKEMVVEFARSGGKVLDLKSNGLSEIFVDNPKLFKDMVVEFVRFGGKWLDLNRNYLTQILDSTIEIEGSITRRSIREIIKETCTVYGVTVILDR